MITTLILIAAGLLGPAIVVLAVLFVLGSGVATIVEAAAGGLVRPNPS